MLISVRHRHLAAAMPFVAVSLTFMLAACEILRLPDIQADPTAARDMDAGPPLQPEVKPPVPLPKAKPRAPVAAPPPAAGPAVQETSEGEAMANRDVPPVIGLNRDALTWHFGPPNAERDAPPARILEFGNDECRLAAYLYFDTVRNDFYVLQYEVNGMAEHQPAGEQCLARISRDPGRR